jgi:hypothetical protein
MLAPLASMLLPAHPAALAAPGATNATIEIAAVASAEARVRIFHSGISELPP